MPRHRRKRNRKPVQITPTLPRPISLQQGRDNDDPRMAIDPGRTARRLRAEIRVRFGFREATVADADTLTAWLRDHAAAETRGEMEAMVERLEVRCRALAIEPVRHGAGHRRACRAGFTGLARCRVGARRTAQGRGGRTRRVTHCRLVQELASQTARRRASERGSLCHDRRHREGRSGRCRSFCHRAVRPPGRPGQRRRRGRVGAFGRPRRRRHRTDSWSEYARRVDYHS